MLSGYFFLGFLSRGLLFLPTEILSACFTERLEGCHVGCNFEVPRWFTGAKIFKIYRYLDAVFGCWLYFRVGTCLIVRLKLLSC